MKALLAGLALLSAPLGLVQPALAQSALAQSEAKPAYAPPRTADGKPDLQGYWLTGFVTPLERPDKIPGLIVPPEKTAETLKLLKEMSSEGEVYDPEFDYNPLPAALLQLNGERRSSLIVEPADGKLPLTALATAVLDQFKFNYDDPEGRPSPERCIDGLVNAPLATLPLLIPLQIVQTPDTILLVMEDLDPARLVALADSPGKDTPATRNGRSRGHWEGDTLVVETSQFKLTDKAGLTFRGSGAFITSDSRVIERFTLTSPETMHYQFTIEDPSLYSKPWRAEFAFTRTPHAVTEYACHEGNRSMINILTAARLNRQTKKERDEQKAAAEAKEKAAASK
jgi:hypothetical protein